MKVETILEILLEKIEENNDAKEALNEIFNKGESVGTTILSVCQNFNIEL